jgi:hypothetical protein
MGRLALVTAALVLAGCEAVPFVRAPEPAARDDAPGGGGLCVGITRDFTPQGPLPEIVRCEGPDGWVAVPPPRDPPRRAGTSIDRAGLRQLTRRTATSRHALRSTLDARAMRTFR